MNYPHTPLCYSGTEPYNKCFCKEKKEPVYKCKLCSKQYGTEQGLKVHTWTKHKNDTG